MRKNKTSQNGFTLIELLVVIAIIALLASVVLVSLNTARQKARDARRIADIRTIQQALALYFDINGTYPNDIYAETGALKPTFLSQTPKDPSRTGGDENYKYACLASGQSYHLAAILEDTGHSALQTDANANSTGQALCGGGTSAINGATSGWYDVRP